VDNHPYTESDQEVDNPDETINCVPAINPPINIEFSSQNESCVYDLPIIEDIQHFDTPCRNVRSNSYVYSDAHNNISSSKPVSPARVGLSEVPNVDRSSVWDNFDEGAVSFDMIQYDNDDGVENFNTHHKSSATVKQSRTRCTLRKSISVPNMGSSDTLQAPPPVTPLPDYNSMRTPSLKAELRKYGLKVVPRRKACQLLNHIYEQTHPLVPVTPRAPPVNKLTQRINEENMLEDDSDLEGSQDSNCSQERLVPDMPEESIMYNQEISDECSQSQIPASSTLHEQLNQFLRKRPSLLQSVLLYQPIWLGEFVKDVKESGIKCKADQVQDWLDIHCITFRTESNRNKNNKAVKSNERKNTRQKDKENIEDTTTQEQVCPTKGKPGRRKK